MAKWIAAEKARAGLGHAVVCPNVAGRTKERIAQSQRARALLTSHKWRKLVSSGRLFCRCHDLSLALPLPLFCFVLVFMLLLKPRPFVQSFFDIQAPRKPHVFFGGFFLLFIWRCRFSEYFLYHRRFIYLCMESTSYVFPFRMVFFYLVTTDWISSCEISINQSKYFIPGIF